MPWMVQQALETAVRAAFLDRPDAALQAAEAARCRAWLESLPLPPPTLAALVEPIAAIEEGLHDAQRRQSRR